MGLKQHVMKCEILCKDSYLPSTQDVPETRNREIQPTYQMNIRHKVSVKGRGDPKGPYAVSKRPPDVYVKHFAGCGTAAAGLAAADGFGKEGFVGQSGQHEDEHEDGQHAQCVVESYATQQAGQHVWERYGEHAAARRHDAVHQAQSPLEVVTQDHQARLIRKTAASCKDYAVGEV